MNEDRAFLPVINVPLSYQGIPGRECCIRPKTPVQQMPIIFPVLPIQIREMVIVEVLREDSIAAVSLEFSAVLHGSESFCLGATTGGYQATLGLCCALRNNVDHAIHCICAPHCPARTADHLDLLDVLQRHVHRVPISPAEKRGIDGSAIHQN